MRDRMAETDPSNASIVLLVFKETERVHSLSHIPPMFPSSFYHSVSYFAYKFNYNK